jgi:hypothetical protein
VRLAVDLREVSSFQPCGYCFTHSFFNMLRLTELVGLSVGSNTGGEDDWSRKLFHLIISWKVDCYLKAESKFQKFPRFKQKSSTFLITY